MFKKLTELESFTAVVIGTRHLGGLNASNSSVTEIFRMKLLQIHSLMPEALFYDSILGQYTFL